ncbi:MAG: pyridoxal 5'-phosphate synthase [Alphaproteobacteria bacterium]
MSGHCRQGRHLPHGWFYSKETARAAEIPYECRYATRGRISGNPCAALCLYRKSTRKQIRIEGRVEQAGEDEADEYFATRSIERKIGAWASKQSMPFAHRAEMEDAVKKYEAEFAGTDHIPRPPYWKGYRVIPARIEFWIAHEARLHTRFAYTREASTTPWDATWLCP